MSSPDSPNLFSEVIPMIEITAWAGTLAQKLRARFGQRLLFVGCQGNVETYTLLIGWSSEVLGQA